MLNSKSVLPLFVMRIISPLGWNPSSTIFVQEFIEGRQHEIKRRSRISIIEYNLSTSEPIVISIKYATVFTVYTSVDYYGLGMTYLLNPLTPTVAI